MKKEIGLYIGRFQPFHNGHKLVIDSLLQHLEHAVICIGMSQGIEKNPYDYPTRKKFISQTFQHHPSLNIFPLEDEENDNDWIDHILEIPLISNAEKIIVYCGDTQHDSAIQTILKYKDKFFPREIQIQEISRMILPVSGSEIRKKIGSLGIQSIQSDVPHEVLETLQQKNDTFAC